MNIRAKIFGGDALAGREPLLAHKSPKGAITDALNSISVEREEYRRGNTRADDRHRLPDAQVRAGHSGQLHDVQLVNVSGGGAMVECAFEPKLWDRVDLHLASDGVIEAAVRWIKDQRIGLEFAHETRLECSADEQAELLRAVIANNFVDIDYDPATTTVQTTHSSEDARAERRHPLIWSGVLHHDFHSSDVRLRNVSSTGALVESESPLPVGAEPLLDLGGAGTIFATVSWVVGDQFGLRFHEPFDLSKLADARPQVAPSTWQRPAYLSTVPGSDSPWAEEWKRMSLAELQEQLDGFIKR